MKIFLLSLILTLFTCSFAHSQSNKAVAKLVNGNVEFIEEQEKALLNIYNKTYKKNSKFEKLTIKKSGSTYYISGRLKDGGFSIAQALEKTDGNYYKAASTNSCTCTTDCTDAGDCDAFINSSGCPKNVVYKF